MSPSANKITYIIALMIYNKQFFKRKAIWCCKNSIIFILIVKKNFKKKRSENFTPYSVV